MFVFSIIGKAMFLQCFFQYVPYITSGTSYLGMGAWETTTPTTLVRIPLLL